MLEEVTPCARDRLEEFAALPTTSLLSLLPLKVENVLPQISVLATCCHASPAHYGLLLPKHKPQKNSFSIAFGYGVLSQEQKS